MLSALLYNFFAVFCSIIIVFEGFFGIAGDMTKKTNFDNCKNVIFMIGDGMGFNSINKAKLELGLDTITMDTLPYHGESRTRSTSSPVTDSAAGGTALACATRTTNGCVGVYNYDIKPYYTNPVSLTELAKQMGKTAGVITTDKTSGATPASFSAHTSSRDNENDITVQQMTSDFDLIWGTKTESFSADTVYANGFDAVITDKASMDALEEGTRSFGQFTNELWHTTQTNSMPTLAEMTAKAIDLLDDDEDGFFLMVEGAHIDKNNHSNNGEGMKDALISFDNAIAVAYEYAQTHGDTLVVITADHETGGITLKKGSYVYTKTGHSGVNVPIISYGCDNLLENGEVMDNKELSRRVACVMGDSNFPRHHKEGC